MFVKPILQALVLADQIYTDELTKKKIIAGTFDSIWMTKFPAEYIQVSSVYISVTNLRGSVPLQLKFVDLASNEVLLTGPTVTAHFADPLATMELVMQVPPFPLPHPGQYALELHANQELLGSLRIRVIQKQ